MQNMSPKDAPKKRIYKSKFNSCVKVRSGTLEWLRDSKDTKTIAGYLDKIINYYRKNYK